MSLLKKKVMELKKKLHNYKWYRNLNAPRRAVCIDMAYNLGVSGLLNFKKTIAFLEAMDFDAASKEMLDSCWASQVGSRALRNARIMREGKYD